MISLVPRFGPNVIRERSRIFNFSALLNSVLFKDRHLYGWSTYKHHFHVFTAVNTHSTLCNVITNRYHRMNTYYSEWFLSNRARTDTAHLSL